MPLLRPIRSSALLLERLIDFIYSPACLSCGAVLHDGERFLCAVCRAMMPKADPADRRYRETSDRLCSDGLIDGVCAPYYFGKGSPVQSLIHELKYGGMTRIGVMLGEEIGTTLRRQGVPHDALVPIPLHRAKQRERGYNQTEYLCRGIAAASAERVVAGALERCRYTRTQTALTKEEREENMNGAFRARRAHLVYDARVLLVDDVITTGSTLRACASVLRTCGVRSVVAAAAAIAEQSNH